MNLRIIEWLARYESFTAEGYIVSKTSPESPSNWFFDVAQNQSSTTQQQLDTFGQFSGQFSYF